MRWAWKIGKLAGIDVYMHATFLLLVGFIFVATWVESHNVARTLFGVLFVLVIFGCIVLHELGHALGLMHTADQRDIMYFFGYGGDIVEYFARYRRQLRERSDIRSISGLSASDIERLMAARRRS